MSANVPTATRKVATPQKTEKRGLVGRTRFFSESQFLSDIFGPYLRSWPEFQPLPKHQAGLGIQVWQEIVKHKIHDDQRSLQPDNHFFPPRPLAGRGESNFDTVNSQWQKQNNGRGQHSAWGSWQEG